MYKSTLLFLAFAAATLAVPTKRSSTDITTVNLGQCSGTPQLYSQGCLYGMTGNNTPPQEYIVDIGINYESAGGAQEDPQPAGYATSMSSYDFRLKTTLEAYQRIKSVNGVFLIKFADLWGADEKTNNDFLWPGDNGNWTKWDDFIQQVISDIKSNGLADNSYAVQLEIWNEPDINFGGRDQSQFNEAWVRAINALRQEFGKSDSVFLPVVGPSSAGQPPNNSWWTDFLSYLQSNGGQDVQPDIWNWHMENGGGDTNDPVPPAQALPGLVQSYGLTTGLGLQNNEYGTRDQQVPGYGAWFKARYERLQFHAFRGNWASGADLSNLLAQLLFQDSNGDYQTTGEYQMYKYYKEMTGSPCSSTAGSNVDSFATAANDKVVTLVGTDSFSGSTVGVTFDSISTYFGSANTVQAQLINIPYNNGSAVNGWTNSGSPQTLTVSNNQATISWDISDDAARDAWAIELTSL